MAACRSEQPVREPAPAAPREVRSVPVEIGAAARQAQLGWRRLPEGFSARAPRWSARLADGAIEMNGSLSMGPAQLSRGAEKIGPARAIDVQREGELRLDRPGAQEEYLASEAGLEQRWRFQRAPGGQGDLLVRVPIGGASFTKATAEGLLFEHRGARFRYGNATWVDALGQRSPVTATFEDRAVVLRVPEELLERSRYPAVLDPLIGPVFDTGGPEWGGAVGLQGGCQLASNGSLYLAVWEDQRSSSQDILATRISASGQVLDRPNLVLSDASGYQGVPRVTWDGTNFLVVWTDASGASNDLGFARVSPSGVVLDPVGRTIVATAARELNPNLATRGSENLLVWVEIGASLDIMAARFDGTGALIGSPFTVSALPSDEGTPAVSWNGTNWFVAWEDGRNDASDLFGARISAAGVLLDPAGIGLAVNANSPYQPIVSWNGVDNFVLWREFRTGTGSDVLAARVTVGGAVLDPGGFVVAGGPASELLPALTVLGSDALVLWTDNRTGAPLAWGTEVSSSGAISVDGGLPWALPASSPTSVAIAAADAGLFVAWTDSARGNSDVLGALSTRAGVAPGVTPQVLSSAPNRQSVADVALAGADGLVVWQDLRGGSWPDLYFTRVAPDGGILDPGGVLIADGVIESNPVVAYGGGQYLVVWEAGSDVRGARFTPAGAPLDPPAGFAVANGVHLERAPALAWNGADFVVAWQDRRAGTFDQIYFGRVSIAGLPLDGPGVALAPSTADQLTPTVAGLDGGALVAWTDARAGYDLYAAVVLADAGLGSPVVPVVTASGNQFTPAVASNGEQHLVVWEDVAGAVRASRLGADLLPLDGAGLQLGPATSGTPAAAWDGEEFVVVWRDSTTIAREIALTRVTLDGRVLDTPGVRVSNTAGDDANPRLACAAGQCLVVWDTANPAAATGRLINAAQVIPNRTPVALSAVVTTSAGTPVAIVLGGTDPDGDALTFAVTVGPDGGVLQGAAPNLSYAPAAGFSGTDELRFVARDATRESAAATITITVLPAPVDAGAPDAGTPDAGTPDAGPPDAGLLDAGPSDAGPPDAGPPDAGPSDAGPPDAGPPDAGPPDAGLLDAGPPDAGLLDAGPSDAGPPDSGLLDAGMADGGASDAGDADAGTPDGGAGTGVVGGCGCGAAPQSAVALLLLTLLAFRRRPGRVQR